MLTSRVQVEQNIAIKAAKKKLLEQTKKLLEQTKKLLGLVEFFDHFGCTADINNQIFTHR